jgi:hypothetical protein
VSADASVEVLGVLTDGKFPEMQAGPSPNQFLQVVPTTMRPGVYHLTALGKNSSGVVFSTAVAIDVEPQYTPAIKVKPSVLAFTAPGATLSVQVSGTFFDGTTLDMTHSSRTTFTSNNPQVATVDGNGVVTAVGPGQTALMVQCGVINNFTYAAAFVQVPQAPPTGTPPAISGVTPTHGVPGTTQVTVNGTGFGATQGTATLLLGTRYATAIGPHGQLRTPQLRLSATLPATHSRR